MSASTMSRMKSRPGSAAGVSVGTMLFSSRSVTPMSFDSGVPPGSGRGESYIATQFSPHPEPSAQRMSRRIAGHAPSHSCAEQVGDRVAAVAAEGAAGDFDARRRLAPLVLGAVEHAPDGAHRRLVMTARDDGGYRHLVLDQAFE